MPVQLNKGRSFGLLDMTPMIDMVFNLLIFFMVVTRFAEEERALEVPLPQGTEAMPIIQRPKELYVNIDQEGRYFVDRTMLDLAEFRSVLRQAKANNPTGQTVIIRADKRVEWDHVAAAFRACQEAGITEVFPAYDEATP